MALPTSFSSKLQAGPKSNDDLGFVTLGVAKKRMPRSEKNVQSNRRESTGLLEIEPRPGGTEEVRLVIRELF